MEKEKLQEFLKDVGEMVNDEEKIVTYKYVSRTLGIHVNTAKQVLHMYVTEQQTLAPCTVSATYLLAGLMRDGSHIVTIVCDKNLEETYSKFEVITSEHVYSIQKGQGSGMEKNIQLLYAADVGVEPLAVFPINCKNIKQTTSQTKNVDLTEKPELPGNLKESNSVKSPRSDGKTGNRKPGHISDFFNNQAQRRKVITEEKVKSEKSRDERANESTGTEKTGLEDIVITEETSEETKILKNEMMKSKKTVSEKKKRKRILLDSSESESDEENQDARFSLDAATEETGVGMKIVDDEVEKPMEVTCKRRRKKTVDRTFLHEDGYLETRKEVVYETDSGNESPPKKENNRNPDAENAGFDQQSAQTSKEKATLQKAAIKKQSSLLSFFKKN
ncbi:UNVERIFIED_CONTAM: hypothetical protein PYX00_005117 [Menopon gallinae]|uniref:DNA polymerase delta subunit 3 n=1 Tax=Menopon gallinae TaxID=328185 RepID=A0AAW2HQQ5_9NEOP